MNTTEILLAVILSVVIIFMVVVGFYFVKLLQGINLLVKKAYGMVEEVERMGDGIQNGFSDMAGFVGGIKSVFKVLETFKKRKKPASEEEPEIL